MNIKEQNDHFEIEFAAPGFSKKDFEVSIDDHVLHVSAERNKEMEEKDENYMRKEFSYNAFKRSLKLPSNADTQSKVKATYKEGILKLQLIKQEEAKETPKKLIEVV